VTPPALTVIGLDAATFDVIDPLLEAGELPAIGRLLANGAFGPLRSTTHPLTPLAWTTMTTGVNAGVHGVWDFTERDESGHHLRLVNGSFRRAPALWELLSARGRTVGIANVPFTWPASEVNGFLLSGLDASARSDGAVFPSELAGELARRFGRLDLDHAFPLDGSGRVDLDIVRRAAEARCAALAWLVERFQPELLFAVFMSADHIHHLAWPEWEERGAESRVADVYRILDGVVAVLCELAGEDANVMLVSDHGGGSLAGVVNLNAWLAREGFLTYADGMADIRTEEGRRRLVHRLYKLQRALPDAIRSRFRRRLPRLRDWALRRREYSVIDWPHTRAFSYGTFGNVVVNVRGREEFGVVEPDDYERLRSEIVERLHELRGPEGDRIVAAVHRREDLFAGACLELLPDLVVEFENYAWLGKGALTYRTDDLWDEIAVDGSPESYVGSHRHDGVFALNGPATRHGRVRARIEDVAPTVLYLLGEPVPPEFEGRVLTEAISEELLDRRPPEYADEADSVALAGRTTYTGEAVDEVEARLRSLGYVE
jgi:predicted AlkP superfamily phosphohydrolase/phosphomutase